MNAPLSSRWRQTSLSSWKRMGWNCALEASYDLTSDATTFHLVETLRAMADGEEIFSRTHTTDIARDLLLAFLGGHLGDLVALGFGDRGAEILGLPALADLDDLACRTSACRAQAMASASEATLITQ